jgi:myo-inositol-1(or 4)-monophosphatase
VHEPSPDLLALSNALRAAGATAMRSFRSARSHLKADGSEVSEADLAAERVLVEALSEIDPTASIRSEEGALRDADPDRTWFVDPLDGTSAYLDGLAHWGPTICLVEQGRLVRGGLYLPRLDELWLAERGGGAWLVSGRSSPVRLAPADPGPVGKHHSVAVPSRFHRVSGIDWPGKLRALGSSAFHLAHVAAGFGCRPDGGGGCVAAVIARWDVWDIGAGVLLVEEAGRQIAALDGTPFDPLTRVNEPFLAGTPDAIRRLAATLPAARATKPPGR